MINKGLNNSCTDGARIMLRLLVNKGYVMNIQTENGVRKEIMDRGAQSIPQADDFFRHVGPLHSGFRSVDADIFLERVPLKKVENLIGNKPGTGRIHVPVGPAVLETVGIKPGRVT
jgi:hypothetical protein